MQKEKFITVMAVLDDNAQELLHSIQHNLEQQYGADTKTKDIPFHITLGSYAVEETEEIIARIKEVAKNTHCFDITFCDLDHLGNMVRFLRPEISKELLELHQHFDSDYANGYPGWMPHATVYRHSEPREIELSKQIADKIEVVKNARIVGIELGEFFPPKKIIRVLFEQ